MSALYNETVERFQNYVVPTYAPKQLFVRGEGARLWDDEGNEFLDFASGISVCNLGHCNKRVTDAICEQAKKLVHVSNLYMNSLMPQLAEKLIDIIDDLSVVVINYTTNQRLISSDVPVIAINPFELHTIGYGCMGIILLFPVSPHQLVVIYDEKMYPRFADKLYVNLSNENEVRHLNVLQFISAEKILFAYEASDFPLFTTDDWKKRSQNREGEAIQALGPSTQKLIATSPRKVIYDCEFTFGRVCSSFAGIPYSCREAVPRAWEEGWEKKLKEKGNIITGISEYRPEMLYSIGLSKKEIRRGCQLMLRAAQCYWKK